MAYTVMKKLITNENTKFNNNMITADDYNLWKVGTLNKLDVFLACNRLSDAQYEELVSSILDI